MKLEQIFDKKQVVCQEEILELLRSLNILVLGLGESGREAYKLLDYIGTKNLYLANRGDFNTWGESGDLIQVTKGSDWMASHCFDEDSIPEEILSEGIDLVILSPGIPRDHKFLGKKPKSFRYIISEVELASLFFRQTTIIGITGTNGKTTTVSLLGEILKTHFKNVFVGGNIGTAFCVAALDKLKGKDYEVILLELSSFQLESTPTLRLNLAAILNLSLNHGERYSGLVDYGEAKINIQNSMKVEDKLLLPLEDDITSLFESYISNPPYEIIKLNTHEKMAMEQEIGSIGCDLAAIKIPGVHNLKNIVFAIEIGRKLGISNDKMAHAIENFGGVSHRLEWVQTQEEYLEFYNDAKSTNAIATMTALFGLKDREGKQILLYGGQKRGKDHISNIKEGFHLIDELYIFGETAKDHMREIEESGDKELLDKTKRFENIREALIHIKNMNIKNKTKVLLSPGFPSFDQFKNFEDRGNKFKDEVRELFN